MVKNIIEALVHASEKAANIARLCRENEHLFPLLVEEKSGAESNPRFVQDFKTLADVLIQQTIKYDIGNLVSTQSFQSSVQKSNIFFCFVLFFFVTRQFVYTSV